MFSEIFLHNFKIPLHKRAEMRKHCGPYRWKPSKPNCGRGFYMGEKMDAPGDSTFHLRIQLGHDVLPRKNAIAFWCDEDGFTTLTPIVALLPHGRGFLAGHTMGENMASSLDGRIYETKEDAAHAAYSDTERAAEAEREYQEQYREESE